ncbi:MAG: inositol monophosphatase [Lentisphaeria bacterium]|nr:inositol monophosphatase [Lentisphaeria bacterium]
MLEFLNELANCAGKEALRYFGNLSSGDIEGKATSKDLVSVADKAVENMIVAKIAERFPDHDIFGEETGHAGKKSEFCWIIDPIDGTQSFVQRHPYFAISIALYRNGKPCAAAVNAPALGRLFTASKGEGAYENGSAVKVTNCAVLSEAACATGFSLLRFNKVEDPLEKFVRILPRLRDIKRCGSAALDLAMTAAGIYDGYWEDGLQLYDVAAGAFIVQEAGGIVNDYQGGTDYPAKGIVAGNRFIAPQLTELLKN